MRSLKVSLWLLTALALSGLALAAMYVPVAASAVPAAPAQSGVTAGYVARGVHFWLAHLVVLTVLAHLAGVLFRKTNRFLIGWALSLLVLTSLLGFTGYLLPWDELPAWLDRSGTGLTLMRVYALHVLLLPLLLYPLAVLYVRRTYTGGPPTTASVSL